MRKVLVVCTVLALTLCLAYAGHADKVSPAKGKAATAPLHQVQPPAPNGTPQAVSLQPQQGGQATQPENSSADNNGSRSDGGNSLDAQGGPDAFGYTWVDNQSPDTVHFNWIEVCGQTGDVNGPTGDNFANVLMPFTFNFPFYGGTYTGVYPSTNGLLQFNAGNTSASPVCMGTSYSPTNPVIAAFWRDQTAVANTNGGCNGNGTAPWIVGKDFGTYYVIEYKGISLKTPTTTHLTYEVILYNNGQIKVQFDPSFPASVSGTCVTGIDANTSYQVGVSYTCVGTSLAGKAVLFIPPAHPPYARCCYGPTCGPSCADTSQTACAALGGTWTYGSTCAGSPCYVPQQGELCCNAFPLTLNTVYHGNTTTFLDNYDTDPNHFIYAGHDVCYSYTAPVDQRVTFSLCGTGTDTTSFQAAVYVYTDSCTGTPHYSDGGCGSRPKVNCMQLSAGHTYFVIVDGYYYANGNYVLNAFECGAAPANDLCANATPITINGGPVSGSTETALMDCYQNGAPDVWYTFTTDRCENLWIDFCGSPASAIWYDTYLYQDCTCGTRIFNTNYTYPGCVSGNVPRLFWQSLPAGTYFFDVSPNQPGPYTVTVIDSACFPAMPNDRCPDAATLTLNAPNPTCGTTVYSVPDCGNSHDDVWYKFTLDSCTNIDISLCGSLGTIPQFGMYISEGSCCAPVLYPTTSNTTACNDGQVTYHWSNVAAGQYWFPVQFNTDTNFCVRLTGTTCPPPFVCHCEDPIAGRYCNTTPQVIFGNGGGVVDSFTVSATDTITDLNVCVDVTCANQSTDDMLTIWIVSPSGTYITLASGVGGGGRNFTCTTFDDQASTPILSGTAPFTGSFIPQAYGNPSGLSTFNGQSEAGVWTVHLSDTHDSAILNWACLTFQTSTGRCCYSVNGTPNCETDLSSACLTLGGAWTAGLTCQANPCPTGRCCYGDSCAPSCAVTLQAYCTTLGGMWTAGADCNTPCPHPTAPLQATNVVASDTLCSGVVITWTDAATAAGYHVWRNATDLGVVNPGVQMYTDTPPAGTYTYKVVSFNGCGIGPDSNTDSGRRLSPPAPATNVVASDTGCASIVITWTDANPLALSEAGLGSFGGIGSGVRAATLTGSTGKTDFSVNTARLHNRNRSLDDPADILYTIYRDGSPIGTVAQGVQTFTDTVALGTHLYKVVTSTACGNGSDSNTDSGTRLSAPVQATLLSPPDNSVVDVGSNQSFCWNPVPGATLYRVQFDNENSFTLPYDEHTTTSTCFSRLITSAGPLYWHVRAEDACGAGPWSTYRLVTAETRLSFALSSPVAGCGAGCNLDTVYVKFNGVDYFSGQMILQLPTGLTVAWTGVLNAAPRVALRTSHLQLSRGTILSGNRVEVDVLWGPRPSNSVDDGLYCAALPVQVSGSNILDSLSVTDISYDFVDIAGEHTTGINLSPIYVLVDCAAPTADLTGGAGGPSCNAYGTEASFTGTLTYAVGAGSPPNTPLSEAFIALGVTQWPVSLSGGTWPTGSENPDVWTKMTEGCNTFVLHVFDSACNETVDTLAGVIKDTTPPTVAANPMHQNQCYNNDPASPQYGRNLIAADLNITASVGTGPCIASQGTLQLRHNGHLFPTTPLVLPVTNWPEAADTTGLWDWIVSELTGGSSTFEILATDCAGNQTTPIPTFTICGDFVAPGNGFTTFDARPTQAGVWLKWAWNYDSAQNDSVEIWRKGESGYPTYPSHLWSNLSSYEVLHANLTAGGWTRVVSQSGTDGSTSAAYDPNPGDHFVDPSLGNYWKDVIGTDVAPQRDIYRYVTFVRDAAGNWSSVASYSIGTNADRSTNYWLGDFSLHAGNPAPYGVVNTVDLNLLAAHYFESVVPADNYLDIGPENHENGYGKGLPSPDGSIDFSDLIPFSFNFGMVTNGGFMLHPLPSRSFHTLDASPVITAARTEDTPIQQGDVFTVTVSLSGNSNQSVKAVETVVDYNGALVELVSATATDVPVVDGLGWSTAKAAAGQNYRVVIAAAAMGESATLQGDGVLAVLQFRWKSARNADARFELNSVKLLDATGATLSSTGSALVIKGLGDVPTAYALYQNFPNPFNPSTTINFDLKEGGYVKLSVFNILGQMVTSPVNGTMEAGRHSINFLASDLPSGLYIYKIEVNGFTSMHKMLLMK